MTNSILLFTVLVFYDTDGGGGVTAIDIVQSLPIQTCTDILENKLEDYRKINKMRTVTVEILRGECIEINS